MRRDVAALVYTALSAPHAVDVLGAMGLPTAESEGLVRWRQGRLHPTRRVEFSLCLTEASLSERRFDLPAGVRIH
jgi:hypothetical protein